MNKYFKMFRNIDKIKKEQYEAKFIIKNIALLNDYLD